MLNPEADPSRSIQISGARTHNLKNVSLSIPRDKMVVITGRSGSGKSSLAIDTLFAEGQRQYIESLSLYSRQFFKQHPRPDVDSISGLPPTLCLQQQRTSASRRSTVGTVTEIYDYLRLLLSRVGVLCCSGCGEPISHSTPQQIRDRLLELPEKTKVILLAPLTDHWAGDHRSVLKSIQRERLVRVRIDGELMDIEQVPQLDEDNHHSIEAVTDRVIIREGVGDRILEAIDLADQLANGNINVSFQDLTDDQKRWQTLNYCTRYACAVCQIEYDAVEPRIFSFNGPYGACERCHGLGSMVNFDPQLVIPDRKLSVGEHAVAPWESLSTVLQKKRFQEIGGVLKKIDRSLDDRLDDFSEEQWNQFLYNRDKQSPGLLTVLEKEAATTTDVDREHELESYQNELSCPDCHGARVGKTALSVWLDGKDIRQLVDLPIREWIPFLNGLKFDESQQMIAQPILDEMTARLSFLLETGLGYLTLGRSAKTLSGGEYQRVRLATSIGSGLTNVCYVLDEPSVGLHPSDTDLLIQSIRNLQRAGNSVVLVEHDETIIRHADFVFELGPQAGIHGGKIVAAGSPKEISETPGCLTGEYLSGERQISVPSKHRKLQKNRCLQIQSATGRNLKSVDVDIPLDCLVCVTGVSGSGKSTLIQQTLVPAILKEQGRLTPQPQPVHKINGLEQVERIVNIDQQPIGRSARGCPATIMNIFDLFRKLFAATPLAKRLGFGVGRFSFNSKSGWCPDCRGYGQRKIEMNFMPDFWVKCESCLGNRFNLQTMQVKFNQVSIADVLQMSIDEASQFFDGFAKIAEPLKLLQQVGLGYLQLGQSTVTLSGGEAQRLKLATELQRLDPVHTLYVLDEPTCGLHLEDVRMLLLVLEQILQQGNSMIIIEHHLDVIKQADWVIDLGPGGGEQGGSVVACGTPVEVARHSGSITGHYLKKVL